MRTATATTPKEELEETAILLYFPCFKNSNFFPNKKKKKTKTKASISLCDASQNDTQRERKKMGLSYNQKPQNYKCTEFFRSCGGGIGGRGGGGGGRGF